MKKKTFFLSDFVAMALFVVATSLVSCNKEDVDYDSVSQPNTYVVYPDNPKAGESYNCPWCGESKIPGQVCLHQYGPGKQSEGLNCSDPTCPHYGIVIRHFHVFDVCEWGHAEHYHVGGGSSNYSHHGH